MDAFLEHFGSKLAPEMVPGVVSNFLRGPGSHMMSGAASIMVQEAALKAKNLKKIIRKESKSDQKGNQNASIRL